MPGQSRRMTADVTESLDQRLREEAALRRVAMLIAEEVPPDAVFEAVAAEAGRLLAPAQVQIARVDDLADLDGTIARIARQAGADHVVGVPVVTGGTPWGALVAVWPAAAEPAAPEAAEPAAPEAAERLADFSHLLACAISNAQARDELRGLAESQGALRRVATLVAQGAEPKTVFTAVAVEAARMLGVGAVSLISYDANTGMLTKIFGTHGQRAAVPDGGQWSLADGPEAALVVQTGRRGSTTGPSFPGRSRPGTWPRASARRSPRRSSSTARCGVSSRPSAKPTRSFRPGRRRGSLTSPA